MYTVSTCNQPPRPTQPPTLSWMLLLILDPKPTCGVTGSGPIFRGQHVTLTCNMTYYPSPTVKYIGLYSLTEMSASIGWQSEAGTFLSNSSANLTDGGVEMQTDVWTLASGTEIPSYNCTSTFVLDSNDKLLQELEPHIHLTVAVNSVSWTCVSRPVKTWCTYLKLLS